MFCSVHWCWHFCYWLLLLVFLYSFSLLFEFPYCCINRIPNACKSSPLLFLIHIVCRPSLGWKILFIFINFLALWFICLSAPPLSIVDTVQSILREYSLFLWWYYFCTVLFQEVSCSELLCFYSLFYLCLFAYLLPVFLGTSNFLFFWFGSFWISIVSLFSFLHYKKQTFFAPKFYSYILL